MKHIMNSKAIEYLFNEAFKLPIVGFYDFRDVEPQSTRRDVKPITDITLYEFERIVDEFVGGYDTFLRFRRVGKTVTAILANSLDNDEYELKYKATIIHEWVPGTSNLHARIGGRLVIDKYNEIDNLYHLYGSYNLTEYTDEQDGKKGFWRPYIFQCHN